MHRYHPRCHNAITVKINKIVNAPGILSENRFSVLASAISNFVSVCHAFQPLQVFLSMKMLYTFKTYIL